MCILMNARFKGRWPRSAVVAGSESHLTASGVVLAHKQDLRYVLSDRSLNLGQRPQATIGDAAAGEAPGVREGAVGAGATVGAACAGSAPDDPAPRSRRARGTRLPPRYLSAAPTLPRAHASAGCSKAPRWKRRARSPIRSKPTHHQSQCAGAVWIRAPHCVPGVQRRAAHQRQQRIDPEAQVHQVRPEVCRRTAPATYTPEWQMASSSQTNSWAMTQR